MQRAPFFSWDFLCFCFSLFFCFLFTSIHRTPYDIKSAVAYGLFTPCGNYWLVVVVDSPLARFDGIRISVKQKFCRTGSQWYLFSLQIRCSC
jgi:hypothetical protein